MPAHGKGYAVRWTAVQPQCFRAGNNLHLGQIGSVAQFGDVHPRNGRAESVKRTKHGFMRQRPVKRLAVKSQRYGQSFGRADPDGQDFRPSLFLQHKNGGVVLPFHRETKHFHIHHAILP